ncbi:MAG: PIN domain nuclease [Verrucomicrobiota bacterium]
MVLIDTSVWIDFLRGTSSAPAKAMESLIVDRADICICGVIMTEILQGIRDNKQFEQTKDLLEAAVFLPMNRETFIHSARLYRKLRKKGFTVRKPIDCMIAAVAIEHDVPLLHNDKDFQPLEKHCSLKTCKTK